MPSKSKAKGKRGEAECCRIFEDVFGGNWKRVFGSGAFVGGLNAYRIQSLDESQIRSSKADIHTPDFMPKLVLEVKNYADFPFHKVLTGPSPQLDEWINEVETTSEENDFWLLCIKVTRKGWYVLFKNDNTFKIGNHLKYESAKKNNYTLTGPLDVFLIENKNKILKLSK